MFYLLIFTIFVSSCNKKVTVKLVDNDMLLNEIKEYIFSYQLDCPDSDLSYMMMIQGYDYYKKFGLDIPEPERQYTEFNRI